MELKDALQRLERALGSSAPLVPFPGAAQGRFVGQFEVRNADGTTRRWQPATLPLPKPLAAALQLAAPAENLPIDMGTHRLTLWAPEELIELQVGYRWHGFTGKPIVEWDERFVVFAEDGGDPLALRLDEEDGPVWLAHRGEGRHHFFEAAPDLATFYGALAAWVALRDPSKLAEALRAELGEVAERLWIWKALVTRETALR